MIKNQYPQPIRKYPDGRLDVANSTFEIPLKAGDNELIIGVSNYFYGWGIVARMAKMDGSIAVLQELRIMAQILVYLRLTKSWFAFNVVYK